MTKTFALDLGTNSIGWALRNPDLTENQIEKVGVLTFNKGVGIDKTGEYSFAAQRTAKRSTRRLYQSRKYRLWASLEVLIEQKYCPLSMENLDKWRKYNKSEAYKNNNGGRVYPVNDLAFDAWVKLDFDGDGKPDYTSPYQLRRELAETKLDFTEEENRYKLGRALYHIAQRRGFKSSRKGIDDVKESHNDSEEINLQDSERKKNTSIQALFDKYSFAKTVGWLFAVLENDGIRIRENISHDAIRQNYKDEINYIFDFQEIPFTSEIYTKLVETGKNKNDGSIFYKRPLRSQKGLVGKCTLEPQKYRIPISHPSFEIFRAWSFINNIKYKTTEDKGESWKPIPLELKQKIYKEKFFRKSMIYFPFSEIEILVNKEHKNWIFNYKPKTTVTGCPLSARLKSIFGDDFLTIKIPKTPTEKAKKEYYDIEDIWHILFSFEDQESVEEFAKIKLNLNTEDTKQFIFAWNSTPVGYGMLSLNAINKINKFLQKGLIYTEAVLLANVPDIIGKEIFEKNEALLLKEINYVIEGNRKQKMMLTVVNNLVSKHKNLAPHEQFGVKDATYQLVQSDFDDIQNGIDEVFGNKNWQEKAETDKKDIINAIKVCYQAYFKTTGLERKDINNERHFLVVANGTNYYKTDSGFYRLPKLIDTLGEFLQGNFDVSDEKLAKIYHPSEINIYPPATTDKNGELKLGTPKTGSFKNPMAMRTLHELRKLMNYMISTRQIDSETRIVVEVARELNDANKRWAIEAWQKQREAENAEFALAIEGLVSQEKNVLADSKNDEDIDKVRLWYEQNDEEPTPEVALGKKDIKGILWSSNKKETYKEIISKKETIDKYRLWQEQDCRCIYTGKVIKISDLFRENLIDFEHTVPRSISFDNSLANLTVCYADFNRTVKKNQIPYNLNNYDEILPRIAKWQDKVERIKQQIDYWKTKAKRASDKPNKDNAIRQRHLWQMDLDYWKNKVDRFTIKEVTSGFKNSQKVDTQLISKYAFHYLKTYFDRVDVQKGSITAEFRKIYGLQIPDVSKDRSQHSHHVKDAAVLTLIPVAHKRDEILQTYYEHLERRQSFTTEPYKGFKREFVWGIDDSILINNITNNQALTPAKRLVRKRGKVQYIEGTKEPKVATGDCIRGQLHNETFLGAIKQAKKDIEGNILRDDNGKIIQEEKVKYVVREPFLFKKDAASPGFKTLEEIEKVIVDKALYSQIEKQVVEAGSLKDAFENGIYMLDRKGNKVNKIRHIRVFKAVNNPIIIKKQTYLSKHKHKQTYYATNATNSYFAIYEGENKIDFDYRNLFEAAQLVANGNIKHLEDLFEEKIFITKGKSTKELKLKYILQAGKKVLFKQNQTEELKKMSISELNKRLYVFTNFESDGRLNFKYHLEARQSKDIKEVYTDSEIDFQQLKPTLRFSASKYSFLVEGYDFEIKIDGTIVFLN